MKTSFKQRMLRNVLHQVLSRRCDNLIHRSGREGEQTNCFVARIESNGKPHLLLDSLEGDIVKCRRWDSNAFSVETEESVSNLVDAELTIYHYYGLDMIEFNGVWDFLWSRCTATIYIRIAMRRAWQAVAQFLFNRRSLQSQQRLQILRLLVSRRLSGNTKGLTAWEVMTELYSTRWIYHPAHEARSSEIEFQLDSLVVSGELEKEQHGIRYLPTPKSVITLEQTDEQDRRHREASRLQFWLVILTLILALAAVVQTDLVRLPTLWDFGRK